MLNTTVSSINSPVRTVKAKVEFYEGSTLVHTFSYNDSLQEITVERIGEDGKFFGFGFCQKANIKLRDVARDLVITTSNSIKIYLGDDELIAPYPTFYVSEVHRNENTNALSITAYDLMYKATGYTVSDIALGAATFSLRDYLMPPSYTIFEFATGCAATLGANDILVQQVGDDEMCFFTYYEEGANFGGEETIREALNDVAEVTQTVYYIDNNDNLVFKRLAIDGDPVLTISKSDYIKLDSSDNRRLGGICSATELGNNISATTEASGTMQYVRDNAFWTALEDTDIASMVDIALATVGGMTINQFDCTWRGNYLLEIGDKIALVTKDNDTVHSFVLNDVLKYNGALSVRTQWKYTDAEESASNPTSLGDALNKTFARVDKANKEIEIVAGETAAIRLDNESIQQTVTKLDNDMSAVASEVSSKMSSEDVTITVQKMLKESGVEAVTTTTGFTFNHEGLHVRKNNSEITTVITEDGMKVSRKNQDVLVADNLGVRAEDLHALTFLIIGENSRFEDYGSRTGCFWIGG
jgi:hypothetical protein